jgi:hypothetical protein
MQITTIGLDLAKHWFQVHGVDATQTKTGRRPGFPNAKYRRLVGLITADFLVTNC